MRTALVLAAACGCGLTRAQRAVKLIIDTDMSIDADDVGALCMAHALVDRGEAEILAVVHDTGYHLGAAAISVIVSLP